MVALSSAALSNKVLSSDAVGKAKLVKGNGRFRGRIIFESLLKKLQTID
jgi:hypothetical protein